MPTQTIGQLLISNNTTVELQATAAATLTIGGYTGTDLSVVAGSALNIAQVTNAITIAVGAGAVGSIAGSVTFTNAAHKLTAADASGIAFQSGSSFTAGTGFSGNAFGASGSVANSVVFNSGSSYIALAGSNPFANNQPSSVVVFNSGSLYKIIGNVTPSFSGRTYADLEIDAVGQIFSPTGGFRLSIDNLTITNGTLNVNMTGTPGHEIKGNIAVTEGATLTFNPATAGTINLNGSSTQTISGDGTFTVSSLADFVVANNVIVDKNITFGGALTINSTKALTVNAGKQLTVSTAFTNNGTLNLLSSNSGTATILPPASITGSGTSNVQQYLPDARNWYISSPVTGAVAPAESVPLVANAGVIAPMQGFWVKAKASGTLTLDNTLVRSHQASNPLKAPAANNTNRQRLRLQVDNGTTTDEALIYFDAAASNAYDAFDSPKFAEANTVTQIFSTADTEKLVINGMNAMPLDTPIRLGFVPGSAASFSIKANEISNLPTGVKVILKDNATLAETDLTDGISTYQFSPEATSADRFSIIFRSPGVTTSINNAENGGAKVFVNANNQITIIAPEKCNYAIYNTVGQLIENGTVNGSEANIPICQRFYC